MTFLLYTLRLLGYVACIAAFVYWLVADHDGPIEQSRGYRRRSLPTVAEEIDPLLRANFERKTTA